MHLKLQTKLFVTMAIAVAVAVMAPLASAKSASQDHAKIPAWVFRSYPSRITDPIVYRNRIHSSGSVSNGFDWASGLIGVAGGLGIALAAAGGLIVLRRRGSLSHV
jgi:hypothetical protein